MLNAKLFLSIAIFACTCIFTSTSKAQFKVPIINQYIADSLEETARQTYKGSIYYQDDASCEALDMKVSIVHQINYDTLPIEFIVLISREINCSGYIRSSFATLQVVFDHLLDGNLGYTGYVNTVKPIDKNIIIK